jgi:hypothetical protein
LPYPSTLQAVREFRHLMLLEEAARERRTASALPQHVRQEGAMVSEGHHDSIVQREIDEALSCRDMPEPSPRQPSPMVRLRALVAVGHWVAPQKPSREHRGTPEVPDISSTR